MKLFKVKPRPKTATTLGDKIMMARVNIAQITQAEFVGHDKTLQVFLSRLEADKIKKPPLYHIDAIARRLGCTIETLLDDKLYEEWYCIQRAAVDKGQLSGKRITVKP
jgi:hypothetical protein